MLFRSTAGLTRVSPDGTKAAFAPDLKKTVEKLGISGCAAGPDGCLYLACSSAIVRVKADGAVSTLAQPVEVKGCDVDFPDNNPNFPMPALRGLAVNPKGTAAKK